MSIIRNECISSLRELHNLIIKFEELCTKAMVDIDVSTKLIDKLAETQWELYVVLNYSITSDKVK